MELLFLYKSEVTIIVIMKQHMWLKDCHPHTLPYFQVHTELIVMLHMFLNQECYIIHKLTIVDT